MKLLENKYSLGYISQMVTFEWIDLMYRFLPMFIIVDRIRYVTPKTNISSVDHGSFNPLRSKVYAYILPNVGQRPDS